MSITARDAEFLANKKKITQKIFNGELTLRPSATKYDRDEFLRIMSKVKGISLITPAEWIPKPCAEDANIYIQKWKEHKETVEQEKTLRLLFNTLMPRNINLQEVILKVACLNSFYGTNIKSFYDVAQHIIAIGNFDTRVTDGDISLIDEFRKVQQGEGTRYLYSFATKYCSFHNPDAYPIYDRYIDEILRYYKKNYTTRSTSYEDLRDYSNFINILQDFKKFYGLQTHTAKELDMYLWQFGKDYYAFM